MACFVSPFSVAGPVEKTSADGRFSAVANAASRSIGSPPLLRLNSHQPTTRSTITTTAARTVRLPFMPLLASGNVSIYHSRGLPPPFLHGRPRLAIGPAPLDRLALVVSLLAFREPEGNLDPTVLEVHAGRHERHAALDRLADQLSNLLAVQQQLALPRRLVIGIAPMAVRLDVDVVDPHFPGVHAGIAVAQVDVPLPDRFDLGPEERHTSLERLEDVVVVERLAVFGDVLLRLLPGGFCRHYRCQYWMDILPAGSMRSRSNGTSEIWAVERLETIIILVTRVSASCRATFRPSSGVSMSSTILL